MELGKLGVWYFTEGFSAQETAEFATKVEELGFSSLWIPETVGRHPFALASWLLASTSRLVVATGIANVYHREPGVTLSAQQTLAEQSDGRFLLGLGVSHKPLVEGLRGLKYGKPIETMSTYLERMNASPYSGPPQVQTEDHNRSTWAQNAGVGCSQLRRSPSVLYISRSHTNGTRNFGTGSAPLCGTEGCA